MEPLNDRQKKDIAASYYHALTHLLSQSLVPAAQARCLIRWALQLGLSPDDLHASTHAASPLPSDRRARIRAAYHLVYMTCLDDVIEDTEVEVAQEFARHLGLEETVVSTLFQSITTADYDELTPEEMEDQIITAVDELI